MLRRKLSRNLESRRVVQNTPRWMCENISLPPIGDAVDSHSVIPIIHPPGQLRSIKKSLSYTIAMSEADAEGEAKSRRQQKKMIKILSKAWQIDHADPFQEVEDDQVLAVGGGGGGPMDLTTMGQSLDKKAYPLGRKGWEQFARELGGIYNRFIAW